MSLSAVALYVLARELPQSHTRAMLSFVPVLAAGLLLRLTIADSAVSTAGLVAAVLSAIGVLLVVSDGLRKRLSYDPSDYDISS